MRLHIIGGGLAGSEAAWQAASLGVPVVITAAYVSRVPAGAALAVDRNRFSSEVTQLVSSHPLISIQREEIPRVPRDLDGPVIVATGPLTSPSLSADIAALVGADHLYFYDAVSPIVLAESIDRSRVFRASRWGRSLRGAEIPAGVACGIDDGEGDYLNCA